MTTLTCRQKTAIFYIVTAPPAGTVDLTNKDELLGLINRSVGLQRPWRDKSGQIDTTFNYYFAVRQLLINANKHNISRAGFKLLTTLLQQLIDEGKIVISKNKEQNNINRISVQRPKNPALYPALALRKVYDYVVKRVYVYLNFPDPLEALKTSKNIAIFGCLDKQLGAGSVKDFEQWLIKYGQKYNVEATIRSFTPEEEEEVEDLYCNGPQIVVELTYTGEARPTTQEED